MDLSTNFTDSLPELSLTVVFNIKSRRCCRVLHARYEFDLAFWAINLQCVVAESSMLGALEDLHQCAHSLKIFTFDSVTSSCVRLMIYVGAKPTSRPSQRQYVVCCCKP